jgi:hypothetical protein
MSTFRPEGWGGEYFTAAEFLEGEEPRAGQIDRDQVTGGDEQ